MSKLVKIGRADEIAPGQKKVFIVDGVGIVVTNLAGKYCAIEDQCTHDGGPLGDGKIVGTDIVCPRHGARFDVCSGAVLALPAVEPVPAYTVEVKDGDLYLDWS